MFARHHYMTAGLAPAARCYLANWQDQPVAFLATLPALGLRGARRVHRLVVLPDYQGLGAGRAVLTAVAGIETGKPQEEEEYPQNSQITQIERKLSQDLRRAFFTSESAQSAQSVDNSASVLSSASVESLNSVVSAVTRFSITTGHPGLIRGLCRDSRWRVGSVSKLGRPQREMSRRLSRTVSGSLNRSTVSFVYHGVT